MKAQGVRQHEVLSDVDGNTHINDIYPPSSLAEGGGAPQLPSDVC